VARPRALVTDERFRDRTLVAAAFAAVFVTAAATPLAAQSSAAPRPRAEGRIDYLAGDPDAVHAGVGVNLHLGTYVRLGLVGAGGASWDDGRSGGSGRGDVVVRFALDPFRERRWGLSAGGGLSVRYDDAGASDRDQWRTLIAIVVDLEGPRVGSVAPAIQVGLGGGARIGAVLRGADRFRR
jgi:hypothetical protein